MPIPNFSLFISESWASAGGTGSFWPYPFPNGNVVRGTNPLYTISDFLSVYPQFGGPVTTLAGTISQNSNQITGVVGAGTNIGQLVSNAGVIPGGTFITALDPIAPDNYTVTLSQAALQNGTSFGAYMTPVVPMYILQLYVNLATSSLVYARWGGECYPYPSYPNPPVPTNVLPNSSPWYVGMGLYIAHFSLLYTQSSVTDSGQWNLPSQIVGAGISRGILTSKSVDGVSGGYTPVSGIESWAAWNLTGFGQLLATMARSYGAGPMWIY